MATQSPPVKSSPFTRKTGTQLKSPADRNRYALLARRRKAMSASNASTPFDDYKEFIEALVGIRPAVLARWVLEKSAWPDLPENKAINAFVAKLTDAQREILATLLQQARDGGIHDTLAYLNDEINLEGLRIVRNGRELPVEPFGTEMYYDWTCRREGDPWPKADGEAKA